MAIFNLNLYQPLIVGSDFITNINAGDTWRRSIRSLGGFWQGSFALYDNQVPPEAFYSWLGCHLVERSGGKITWHGLIYELELEHKGVIRRRSLDMMFNAVEVNYQSDGEVSSTGYSTQAQSIARYGRREQILSLDDVPTATAQGYRATFLAGNAWPWARPVGIREQGKTRLSVTVCGYVFTANWLFAQAGDGAAHNINHWISAIVGTSGGLSSDHGGSSGTAGDCQFLKAGNVATNTLQIKEEYQGDIRAWSKLEELATLGDSSGNPWRAWVDVGELLHYGPVDLSPVYYLRDGTLYDTITSQKGLNPWLLRPGTVRVLDYVVRRAEPGSILDDARDVWIEEIEVGAQGDISLKTGDFDESEIYNAHLAQAGGMT